MCILPQCSWFLRCLTKGQEEATQQLREQLCLTCCGQLLCVDSMLERHFHLSDCLSELAWWRASIHSTECCLNPNTVTSSHRDNHCFSCGIKQGGNTKSAGIQEPAGASSATAALQGPGCGAAWLRGCCLGSCWHVGLTVVHQQARLEVHRFGITGYGKGKERVLERERAIVLGAKVRGCLPWSDLGEGVAQGRCWDCPFLTCRRKMDGVSLFFPVRLPKEVT